MQIRRDYTQPFFREKKRPSPVRYVVLVLVLLAGAAWWASTQPIWLENTLNTLLNDPPTPTPLPRELMAWAEDAQIAGNLPQAIAFYEAALAQRPDNPDYLYAYGQALIESDRAEEALEVAQRISENVGQDARGYTLRARALVFMGQSASAIPIALTGLELDPNFGALYEVLARAYAGQARWRDALNAGKRATELMPNDARAFWAYANVLTSVASYDEAMGYYERAIELAPTFLPPYFELAFLLLSQDRNQEAIDLYDRILGFQPRNARALLRQCDAYRKIGEFERAVGLCQDASEADFTFVPAQYRLGILRYSRREFSQAEPPFQRCIDAAPDNLECRYYLGLTHYYLGNCERGWDLLKESERIAIARDNTADALNVIQTGLLAISNDTIHCPAYAGQFRPPLHSIPSETTPEAEETDAS